jgi:hypothetical protein
MKPEHIVRYVVIVEKPVEDRLVSFGLPDKEQRKLARLRTRQ